MNPGNRSSIFFMLECNSNLFVWLAALVFFFFFCFVFFILKTCASILTTYYKITKYRIIPMEYSTANISIHMQEKTSRHIYRVFFSWGQSQLLYPTERKKNLAVLNEILWKLLNCIFRCLYIRRLYLNIPIIVNFAIIAKTANRNIHKVHRF